ncbi:MAG: PD-(D/E)XK nuclease family protein [Hyphomicrobiaceae bacterium]
MIGLDDDDLMSFAPARKGALWSALIEAARSNPPLQPAAETLRRWRSGADQLPPFEFYAELLDRDGGRGRLIARLGAEAADAITEFLDLALAFDEVEPPSLTGFLQWLRNGTRQIKRDMEHGRDEVRVLTVHGAKGLEAPIVFMADTCSISSGRRPGELIELNGTGSAPGAPSALAWPVKGSSRLLGISAGRRALQAADAEERDRLLYVAMTRARDHLVVAGFEGRRGRDAGCWYELISQALTDRLETAHDRAGRSIRRLVCAQTAEPETARHAGHLAPGPLPPPDWANQPAPREPHLVIPVAPSRLAPYDIDETGEPTPTRSDAAARDREPDFPSPLRLAGDHRFLRGTLTHALLEHLPSLDPKGWEAAARGFVEARGQALPPGARTSIVAETLAVLRTPRFATVFGPEAQSEVPVVAVIEPPSGKGPELRLNGQIDRLVVGSREILIVDYKTNRPPPSTAEGVAVAYLTQLAAYRLALARIYPAHGIRAAILWTDGARLMEIPSELLDRHASMLWQLADRSLDAGVRGS